MFQLTRTGFKWLALLLSGVGLFLSSWIIIPAPTLRLLTLGVGAPEVSPWLLVLNAIAFESMPFDLIVQSSGYSTGIVSSAL